MKRREFTALWGGAGVAALWPFAARAQQPAKTPLIGFLGAESASGYKKHVDAFRAGLREAGYVEGKNVRIEFRWAESRYDRLPELAEQLVRLGIDVLVTHGVPGTNAAKRTTRTIPIVMASAGDAVASGLVSSLARPGGNVTGSTFFVLELLGKRLEMLKEAMPQIAHVAVLINPDNPITQPAVQALETAAHSLKLRLQMSDVRKPEELEGVIAEIGRKRADALLVPEYSMFVANAQPIARLASAQRLPTIGFNDFAEAGGLLGYGYDSADLFRQAAVFVDRILKGARPADLPVQRATKFELIVNRKVAQELGVSISQRVLIRADRLIE